MKSSAILLLLFASILFSSGCASLPRALQQGIPNGSWEKVDATVTGKFSSTKILAAGVVKSGASITARELHVRHSNAWVPLVEIDAVGYSSSAPAAGGPPAPLF
jgi:hypothetical protein